MFSGVRVHASAKAGGPPILGTGTLSIKVDKHFFIHGSKRDKREARKSGTPVTRYIAFNKSVVTENKSDEAYRYKVPLPDGAVEGEMVSVQIRDAVPFTNKDFMIELDDDLNHHPGNMADPRAIMLILLFFGPFFLITGQSTMFAQDLGVRGPAAVKQGDLFKLHDSPIYDAAKGDPTLMPDHLKGRYWGPDPAISQDGRGRAAVFAKIRGNNPQRDDWERQIALAWAAGDPTLKDDGKPTVEPYLGDLRTEKQKADSDCTSLDIRLTTATVQRKDRDGGLLDTFSSEATLQGTYCSESVFFVMLMFVIPFMLIGGFVHMTVGWRTDLKDYIKAALTRGTIFRWLSLFCDCFATVLRLIRVFFDAQRCQRLRRR